MACSSRNQVLRLSSIPDGIPKVFQQHGFSREFFRPTRRPENATLASKLINHVLKQCHSGNNVLIHQRPCSSLHVRVLLFRRSAGPGRSGSTEHFGVAHALVAQVDDDEKLQLMLSTSTTRHYYSNLPSSLAK